MKVVDLTFIIDEQRRVQIADADNMFLVWDTGIPVGVAYRDDGLRWDHRCQVIADADHGRVQKRIAAFLSPGHRIVSEDPITIEGSLRCLSCELHGFIREGRWVSV